MSAPRSAGADSLDPWVADPEVLDPGVESRLRAGFARQTTPRPSV